MTVYRILALIAAFDTASSP